MGRQTEFHMLAEDARSFLDFVHKHDAIVATLNSSDSPKVEAIPDPVAETRTITLWNQSLLSSLERKQIVYPGREYYRVDDSLPTLEYSPSILVEWNEKAALRQGRIYGFFDKPVAGHDKWYEALARWIRSNFVKSPIKLLGGYVGPAAFKWFQSGGILLPMLQPPITAEWIAWAEAQHSVSAS